jgi:hypothetical protein
MEDLDASSYNRAPMVSSTLVRTAANTAILIALYATISLENVTPV